MKLLFVSGNLCNGGAQRVISVIASELAEMGHDVSLLLFCRNEKEYPLSEKVKITAIRESFAEYEKVSGIARAIYIRKYLKALKPQVAIGFLEGGYGLYLSSIGMKFMKVASVRNNPIVILRRKGLRALLDKAWFRAADAVVLQTKRQKEYTDSIGWKNRTVIANPVSDAALAVPPHDYDRSCRRIVMAGRLEKQKNYPMAFAAMEKVLKMHPDVILDIFGKGKEEATLRSLIEQMGLQGRVFLRGWTQNVLDEYEKSDVYVMSSDYEGMPNALMEAMAAGLPCVATDCDTGPADLIEDGENGYLVPVNDADAMAKRIIEIMDMTTEQRQHLGENARNIMAEEFNSQAIAKERENLLFRLQGEK